VGDAEEDARDSHEGEVVRVEEITQINSGVLTSLAILLYIAIPVAIIYFVWVKIFKRIFQGHNQIIEELQSIRKLLERGAQNSEPGEQ